MDTASLKGFTLQIAAQLPPDRQTALKVLDYAREIVTWRADEAKQPAAIAVLPPRGA